MRSDKLDKTLDLPEDETHKTALPSEDEHPDERAEKAVRQEDADVVEVK
jgi:hypothetical protein